MYNKNKLKKIQKSQSYFITRNNGARKPKQYKAEAADDISPI